MTASPSGLSAALLPTQSTLCGSEPKAFPVGKGTQCPFQLLRNRGAAQHWHFPGSHGLALLGPVPAWSLPGGELCHGFATLLLVFHIITSWTKEKNYVSQRTSRSQKEDTSQKIRHLVARGILHFCLLPGEEWVCFPSRAPSSSKAFSFGNSLTLYLSLSLSLYCSFAPSHVI